MPLAEVNRSVASSKAVNSFAWVAGPGSVVALVLSLFASLFVIPSAAAMPSIPDRVPAAAADGVGSVASSPEGAEVGVVKPTITVTREDGAPIDAAPVRRGDVLLVHGEGFDPGGNRGGYPMPVPPGVPNGVYVLYSAFPDQWKPSEGVDGESREHPHDRMAWVMPDGTLDAVPGTGINMRRQLARVSQPMADDGSFTARIVVDPADAPPGDNWGVYVYPAAGSVNADEELFEPIAFSSEPGPNTPPPSSADLVIDSSVAAAMAEAAGGGVTPKKGAVKSGPNGEGPAGDGTWIGFTMAEDSRDPATGLGTVKFRGTADVTSRFSIVHTVFRDPWIEVTDDGTFVSAEVSERPDVGPDSVRRVRVAKVLDGDGSVGDMKTTMGDVRRVR